MELGIGLSGVDRSGASMIGFKRIHPAATCGGRMDPSPRGRTSEWLGGCFRRHAVARFCTASAQLGTLFHYRIVSRDLLATFCAAPAQLGAETTCAIMERGRPSHKISRDRAELRTVHQQPDMDRGDMAPPECDTMVDQFDAACMAVLAELDTMLHLLAHMMCIHRSSLC